MRIFSFSGGLSVESSDLNDLTPQNIKDKGFIWIACARKEFEAIQEEIQLTLSRLVSMQILDLHIADLLNQQLPSHFDYTSQYDLLVFRRLAANPVNKDLTRPDLQLKKKARHSGPVILRQIDTSPVGFALFDHILVTVHPEDCSIRDAVANRLLHPAKIEPRDGGIRSPSSTADLMLRIVNQMVDGFLDLRRELTHQLDHWQSSLLNPKARFNNWRSLLEARVSLHQLDEVCEDQRSAIQDWLEAIKAWPEATTPASQRERDLLEVSSRDVLEHIERVVHHVQRLEQNAETAVQMHFTAQGHRTNEIMRTLTVLTAVFLPLNLIAGIFGMNFESIPLIKGKFGFWEAMILMVFTACSLLIYFRRKHYLDSKGE